MTSQNSSSSAEDWGFPIPGERFDQKNEMFKRAAWDPAFETLRKRFYQEVVFQDRLGWNREDFAVRNASWNTEWAFGMGNSRSNSGLYAWEGLHPKAERFLEAGGRVTGSPEKMARLVKRAALHLGADLVGICRVHPNWVYSHEFNLITHEHYPIELPEGCTTAVVMAVEMDYETMRSSSMVLQGAATGLAYSKMAFLANLLAAFIRGLGYRAVPCGNDTALSIPLAMAAGLGEWSRMGLLVTERFGPRVRICKVFTDMPLQSDSYRPFGVVEFCRTCKVCAAHCPSQAISSGEMTTEGPNISSHSGIRKWYINAERCFSFWGTSRIDCTQCIRVCPFNKRPGVIHDITRLLIRKWPALNPLFVRIDRWMGYTRPYPPERFWGDLS
ncbi:MAG: reductive dehalogenase [Deltaproteobacteria bacterium]|nr:reductive dehalogenase [Deltaproteobacteria bacterium]MBW2304121.1 reductive dehalogenase [Deltaproteobacteria bacterium]